MVIITKMKNNIKKLVTHNGSFHTDDIFAATTLSMILEKKGEDFEIIRTRNSEIIDKGDYVFDVGEIYNEKTNRFDHHQKGGAGKRDNGIEYSSFGLIWKKFGKDLCNNNADVWSLVDSKIVAPIDASDNGFDLVKSEHDIFPYFIQNIFISMRPTWLETNLNEDEIFLKSIKIAKEILSREIIQARDFILAKEKVLKIYQNTKDKRIIILDKNYPYKKTLDNFSEPFFVIYPRTSDKLWGVTAVRKNLKTFENRKKFPEAWGGLKDEELQKVTGIEDAVFCHRALFIVVAKSKKGAIELAKLALKD